MVSVHRRTGLSRTCEGVSTFTLLVVAPVSWCREIAEPDLPAPKALQQSNETVQLPDEKPQSDEEGVSAGGEAPGAGRAVSST